MVAALGTKFIVKGAIYGLKQVFPKGLQLSTSKTLADSVARGVSKGGSSRLMADVAIPSWSDAAKEAKRIKINLPVKINKRTNELL